MQFVAMLFFLWCFDSCRLDETGGLSGELFGDLLKCFWEVCVNDTWLRAWNAMPDERPAILSAFLGAITRNLSLDRYRKLHTAKRGKGEVEFIFDELTDQVDKKEPSHYIEEQELVACINHFLKNLPKEHRVMFVRRYWYFDSITEIAERCACSEAKVKTTLFRVRGKLLDYLKKEGYAL